MVSKVNVYLRTWPFAIDPNDRPGESSIRIPIDPVNAPVVLDDLCDCKLAAAQQKETQREHGDCCKEDGADGEKGMVTGGGVQVYIRDSVRRTESSTALAGRV